MANSEEEAQLQVRACGMVHADGSLCTRPVYYEVGCCSDTIFNHEGPHQHVDNDGVITHRWREKRVIEDLPFDSYKPLDVEEYE